MKIIKCYKCGKEINQNEIYEAQIIKNLKKGSGLVSCDLCKNCAEKLAQWLGMSETKYYE